MYDVYMLFLYFGTHIAYLTVAVAICSVHRLYAPRAPIAVALLIKSGRHLDFGPRQFMEAYFQRE